MPFVKPANAVDNISSDDMPELQLSVAETYNEPTTGEVFGAAFRKENSLVSAFANRASLSSTNLPEFGYDAMTDIAGYEAFAEDFINSESKGQTAQIKSQIDREIKDNVTLAQAGATGFAAMMAAGVTDPVLLATMFTGAGWIKGAESVGGAFVKTGVVAGVGEIPAEIIKHSTQKTRTIEESLINIGGATLLSGILGGTVKGLTKAKTLKPVSVKNVNRDTGSKMFHHTNEDELILEAGNITYTTSKKGGWAGSNAVEVITDFKKPLNFTDAVKIVDQIEGWLSEGKIKDESGVAREFVDMLRKNDPQANFGFESMPEVVKILKEKGFDGWVADEGLNDVWHVSFTPENNILKAPHQVGDFDDLSKKAATLMDDSDPDVVIANSEVPKDKVIFHGTGEEFAEFDVSKSADGTIWFTDSKQAIESGEVAAAGKGRIVERTVNEDKLKLGGWDEADQFSTQELIEQGYDGLKLPDEGETTYQIFHPEKLNNVDIKVEPLTSDLELVNVAKIEQWGVSPLVRNQSSGDEAVMRITSEMMESPLVTKGNVKGIANAPVGGSVETRIKRWDAPLAETMQNTKAEYTKYRQRIVKEGGSPVKYGEFKDEVSLASIMNDTSNIPEAASASKFGRDKVFNPLKDAAIEGKLLPEDVEVSTAASYLMRIYKAKRIIAKRDEWNNIVDGWLRQTTQDISQTELILARNSVTDNILGTSAARSSYDIVPLGRGPLKERTFNIPDEYIRDFLETDYDLVTGNYVRTMAPDVELTNQFGRADMGDQLEEIAQSFDKKMEGKKGKELVKIQGKKEAALRDTEAMRDRLRGTYKMPADPSSFFVRAGRAVRDVNFLRMLGSMTLSAIPDMARPVAVNGLRPVAKGMMSLATSPKRFKMAAGEAKKAAVGLDMVLNSTASKLADISDTFARGTKAERALKAGSDVFSKVSLMAPWNAAMKQFSGVITSDRILNSVIKSAAGKLGKNETRRLAQSGISKEMAERIANQFAKHGDDGTIKLPQGDKWDDYAAMDTFRSAVLKDVDRTIVTPGKGEPPLWSSSETGKMVFQFKTFASAAHHKILLADLQHRDLQALNGFVMSVALGSLTYGLKNYVAGREVTKDPEKLIVESLDRSGAFGYLWDMNNMLEKSTRGEFGINPLLGGSPMSRYASRNITGALLGPSFGTMEDVTQVIGGASSGDFSRSDLRRLRKLMPGQNLFYMRQLLNNLEDKAGRRLK